MDVSFLDLDEGLRKKLDEMIENGIDVNTPDRNGRIALNFVVENKVSDLILFLLRHSANPYLKKNVLYEAAGFCNVEEMRALLRYKMDIEFHARPRGETALHTSCYCGDIDVVKELIAHGADVNSQDLWGNTPLMHIMESVHVGRWYLNYSFEDICNLVRFFVRYCVCIHSNQKLAFEVRRSRYQGSMRACTRHVNRHVNFVAQNYSGKTAVHAGLKSRKAKKIIKI